MTIQIKPRKYEQVLILAKYGYTAALLALQDAWECLGSQARTCKFWQAKGSVWPQISQSHRENWYNNGPLTDKDGKPFWESFDIDKEMKRMGMKNDD